MQNSLKGYIMWFQRKTLNIKVVKTIFLSELHFYFGF